MNIWKWLLTLLSGKPHFVVGNPDRPYLLRWYVIPRNRWLNIYLHKFLRDDDDRALHDHPWWFWSLMFKGMYTEVVATCEDGTAAPGGMFVRAAPSLAYRPAAHRHRVVLQRNGNGIVVPCWTLVVTGPKSREWGFWCPKGFVPWQEFCARDNHGSIGKGCGE